MLRRSPISTLFPYTTLFRSANTDDLDRLVHLYLAALDATRGHRAAALNREDVFHRHQERLFNIALRRRNVAVYRIDRKSTRLNSSHGYISYAVFCLKKKNRN